MYIRKEILTRKEYKERIKAGKISSLNDVYKTHDWRGRIIYTIYEFVEEKEG